MHFPAQVRFFLRVLQLTEWLKVFCKFFSILWQPASQSGSYIYLSVHALHAPYLRRVLSSWQLMLTHLGLCVGLYLGLGHFSVVEFWFIQGVSDAMLGHAAPRLCWLYLRLTLSNIQAMLSSCCVPLSPCCADVGPTNLGTFVMLLCSVCFFLVVSCLG